MGSTLPSTSRLPGAEKREVTIKIQNRTLEIKDGLVGKPDVHVTADAKTWLGFLAKEKNLIWALDRKKDSPEGQPEAAPGLWQMLSQHRCHGASTSRFCRHLQSFSSGRARYQKNDPATGKIRWLGKLKLAEVEEVTHNVKTFRFKSPDGGEIPFDYLPGQFLTLHIAPRGIPTRRSYTIASTPTWRDRIEITVKREPHGLVSRWLHDELKVGDEVEIEAPNGTFVFNGEQGEAWC